MNKFNVTPKNEQVNIFKYIFFLLIIFMAIVLIWADKMGNKQDVEFLNDHTLLQTLTNVQTSDQVPNGIEQLTILQQKYSDEYLVTYQLAIAHLNKGDMAQALILYKRTLDLNPYVVENKEFMYQLALILFNNEQIDNAMQVVEKAKLLSPDEEYQNRLKSLVENIEKNKG